MDRREFLSSTLGACAAVMLEQPIVMARATNADEGSTEAERMVVIRVYGSILYATGQWGGEGRPAEPLTPAHIDGWMKRCAAAGVTSVLWRANCAGTLTYPSRHAALAGEPPLPDPNAGMGVAVVKQGWTRPDWDWLGAQCRRFDTLATAVRAAHVHGLKILLDFHTFDMVGSWCRRTQWPDGGERAWDPDGWLWSRDGEARLAGIPCYADPVVRGRRVAEIEEALERGVDGIVLGFFSHCDGHSGDRRCWFGYNPVIVEQYGRRYGGDPRGGDVDPHRMYALHGAGFTQFVREAAKAVRTAGANLVATTRIDGVHGWGAAAAANGLNGAMDGQDLRDGKSDLPLAAGIYLETEAWAREGLVDALMCCAPFADAGLPAVTRLKSDIDVPVYLWRKYTGWKGNVSGPMSMGQYRDEARAARRGDIDGYCLHAMQIVRHPWFDPDWSEVYAG